jgi:hypothetical protein
LYKKEEEGEEEEEEEEKLQMRYQRIRKCIRIYIRK